MKKFLLQNLILILILLLAFIVRLYRLDNPIGDWHSWRQADTSAVSRFYVENGIDLLHPHFEDLSNVPSGLDNPKGYRFVEFPIYNATVAIFYKVSGLFTIEIWGRLISIFASLGSIWFLYALVKKYGNKKIGLFSAFFYAFLPYNIYYGRTILPDPTMVTATLGALYFFSLWAKKDLRFKISPIKGISVTDLRFLLALLFTALALLLKPYAIFFLLPMVYIVYDVLGFSFWKKWQLWIFAIVSVAPLIAWRVWMMQFPEGIPANTWLFNGNGIRFRPAFFRWILYERVTKLISGYFGVLLLMLGSYEAVKMKGKGFFLSFLIAAVLYVCVVATGNVQHDYYQILIMPTVAMFYGLGAWYLYDRFTYGKTFYMGRILLVLITFGTFYFGWQQVKDYFNINNEAMVRVGQAVDRLIPKDSKIIAPLDGDTSFLYQTKRKGWPSFQNDLPIMINQLGADYLVIVHPGPQDFASLEKKFKLVSKTDEYILVNLREKP